MKMDCLKSSGSWKHHLSQSHSYILYMYLIYLYYDSSSLRLKSILFLFHVIPHSPENYIYLYLRYIYPISGILISTYTSNISPSPSFCILLPASYRTGVYLILIQSYHT